MYSGGCLFPKDEYTNQTTDMNLKGEEFSIDEIAEIYRFRLEIKSLFDETKNECTLGNIKVTRDGAFMTFLYTALIRRMVLQTCVSGDEKSDE